MCHFINLFSVSLDSHSSVSLLTFLLLERSFDIATVFFGVGLCIVYIVFALGITVYVCDLSP